MPYSQMFKHKMIQKMIGSDAISATADGFCLSAAAAIDRRVHHRVILELNIESYRETGVGPKAPIKTGKG